MPLVCCGSADSVVKSQETGAPSDPTKDDKMPKVLVLYYSMYGHIKAMADKVVEGLTEAGIEAVLKMVPETLPAEVLEKMHAPAKPDVPIADPHELAEYDGILFGIPTRFGMACAQMKSFLDATGSLWMQGKLVGKPAGIFFSTGTQGGGQETTALTFITQLTHHGMLFVPIGYSSPLIMNLDEIHGGSPYGAGTLAGADGSRMPSELELNVAKHQGSYFAGVVKKLSA
mmetsp:Transcript_6253/g.8779  ORF Transcript_6253/g.8779 Transcript_6253/m.8779 type:complete len:229 (+) Transcript_6253:90-776(+)